MRTQGLRYWPVGGTHRPALCSPLLGSLFAHVALSEAGPVAWGLTLCSEGASRDAVLLVRAMSRAQDFSRLSLSPFQPQGALGTSTHRSQVCSALCPSAALWEVAGTGTGRAKGAGSHGQGPPTLGMLMSQDILEKPIYPVPKRPPFPTGLSIRAGGGARMLSGHQVQKAICCPHLVSVPG